jgi:tRNA pseudouridine55 synthase
MGHLRRTGTTPFDDRDLVTMEELVDALAYAREAAENGDSSSADDAPITLRDVVDPAERALKHLPAVTIAPSAAAEVAEGAPVYAPGVLEGPDGGDFGAELEVDESGAGDDTDGETAPLVACYTPDGAALCLGRLVGDPDADEGTVVDLERVLGNEIDQGVVRILEAGPRQDGVLAAQPVDALAPHFDQQVGARLASLLEPHQIHRVA